MGITNELKPLLGGTVKELISVLQTMPPKANVMVIWDGCMRTHVHFAWLARNGCVALADYSDVVYNEDERPNEDQYWRTPEKLDRDV